MAFKKGDMKSRKAKKPHKKKSKVHQASSKFSVIAAQMAVPSMLPTSICTDQMFRVTNEKEVHHGYQWHDGFNKDTQPFAWWGSCCPGGLYFTNIHNLWAFLGADDARWVRLVQVPEGEKRFVMDPDRSFQRPTKWRAHCVIAEPRMDLLEGSTWELLDKHGLFNKKPDYECLGLIFKQFQGRGKNENRDIYVSVLFYCLKRFGEVQTFYNLPRVPYHCGLFITLLELSWKEGMPVVENALKRMPHRFFSEYNTVLRYLTEVNKVFGIPFLEIRSQTKRFVKENEYRMPKGLGFFQCLYKDIRSALSANSLESLIQVLHNI